jgi:(p)ppGpp synthase/HD superfamily hydrolase
MQPEQMEDFVKERHAGQFTNGEQYIDHLRRVRNYALDYAHSLPEGMLTENDLLMIELVSLAHDTIEDKKATREEFLERGASAQLVAHIERLARPENPRPEYQDWIKDLCNGHIVELIVKLGDNRDNGDPARIARLPVEKQSLKHRYSKAKEIMIAELNRREEAFLKEPRATKKIEPNF